MQITAIVPQKHDPARCNIEVDGRFYCGMKLETVMKHRLKAGTEVDGEELSRIQLESEKAEALEKALSHISASMKPEREIRTFLSSKGYLGEVCDYVVERMKYYGFLDDAEYARRYVESASKKKGSRLVSLELRRKGISDADAAAALEGVGDETQSARAVLEKYLRGKDVTDRKVLQKAYSHLLSKGFDYETAKAALGALSEEE